ncbi:MAG: ATP-binding protein [Candidatus Marsarchaeota archaeon]|nr:ATP-binding protein [Candidatus Marsarchaeota archaeon]
MLNELEIHDFKGISSMKLNLKKITILVGRNNTSKTSVLQSIDLLYNHRSGDFRRLGGYRLLSLIKSGKNKATINGKEDNGTKLNVSIEMATQEEILSDIRKRLTYFIQNNKRFSSQALIGKKEDTQAKVVSEFLDTELIKNLKALKVINWTAPRIIIPYISLHEVFETSRHVARRLKEVHAINISPFTLDEFFESNFSTHLDKNVDNGVKFLKDLESIREIVSSEEDKRKQNQIEKYIVENRIVPDLTRFDFDYITYKDGSIVPFSYMGDGFKAIIGLLWQYIPELQGDSSTKILLLDEPEIRMHPGFISELTHILIQLSQKKGVQILISTHSIDLINSILELDYDKEFLAKEVEIIQMQSLQNRDIVFRTVSYEKARELSEELSNDLRGI